MPINKFLKDILVYLAVAGLLFLNLNKWQAIWLNWPLFLIFVIRASVAVYWSLVKFFNFSNGGLRIKILSVFAVIMSLSSGFGALIVFYRFTPLSMALIFLGVGIVMALLKKWAKNAPNDKVAEMDNPTMQVIDEMPSPFLSVLFFLGLAAFGFYLLYFSRTGEPMLTPWQTIDTNYLPVFLLTTATLGLLIFSNLKAKTILFLIFLQALLLHSYLPFTHEMIYGADGWRHMAVESRLVQGLSVGDVQLSQPVDWIHSLDFGRLAYGQFWGLGVMAQKILGFSLLGFNKWLLPIVWSLILPILLFEIGRLMGWNKKEALFLAWLGFLPFAWQVGGSYSLPVNLGFLWWLFLILLIFKRMQNPRAEQLILLFAALIFSVFGYSLYVILLIFGWALAEMIFARYAFLRPHLRSLFKKLSLILATILSILLVPILEIISKYSFIARIDWLAKIRQLAGNLTGWYLAGGPRPHDILTGNIIINQTPSYAFVTNFLIGWRWWMVALMVIFLALVFAGWLLAWRIKENGVRWFASFTTMAFGSYVISRYFLSGEQVLSRRLDNVLALCFLVLLVICLREIYHRYLKISRRYHSIVLVLIVIIFSLFGTAIYSLGPDTRTVGEDEYGAMEYIWKNESASDKYCVMADTYPLLALEYFSGKKIVGGGFPIDEYFAQPEKDKVFNQMSAYPQPEIWQSARAITGADRCYFVTRRDKIKINEFTEKNLTKFRIFGNEIVWMY